MISTNMSNSDLSSDPTIVSNEHYEFLQLSQVGRISERASKIVDAEEQSLRQFNAELLQKIGEYRKKNLELAASENELKTKLALQAKQASDKERDLTAKFQQEIEQLTKELERKTRENEESTEDWSRRLSKLSDESWAQGLENENLKRLEEDLKTAYEALRREYANMDRCYTESNAALVKLQSDMRERFKQHETELEELTAYLTNKAEQDSALIRDENQKLKENLNQRDTRLDQDRQALQTWKEQLSYLDQHLKQFSEKLKKSKAEMLRLTKNLEDEVKFAVSHPFTDYLEMADQEIAQIQQQLSGISSMSPLRAKLEARLTQANTHRDGIRSILDRSTAQLNDHSKSIQTLIRSVEYLT